jgi:enterochelin esterase-like enzyme
MGQVDTLQPVAQRARTARRPGVLRLVLTGVAVVWLALGALGVVRYVHGYWMYRGFPAPTTPKGIPQGRLEDVRFWSPALRQRRRYLVYLPPAYASESAAGRRFPVLYLLHAPPGRPDGFIQAGALAVDANVMIARHRIRPMILVIPYGKSGSFGSDTEWANARAGRYESFVMDVVRSVDRRFATVPNRQDRGIAGLSEGGYGALNVGLHHLGAFSALESWSGYYAQTATGPFAGLSARAIAANSPAVYLPSLAPAIRRLGLRVYLYQGVKDEIRPERIRRFSAELYRNGAYVRWGFFPGGHDWGLWRRQTPHMLRVASTWFSTRPTADRLSHAPRGHGRPEHPRSGHPNPRGGGHRAPPRHGRRP